MNVQVAFIIVLLGLGIVTQYAFWSIHDHDMELHYRLGGNAIRSYSLETILASNKQNPRNEDRLGEAQVTDIAIVYSNMSRLIWFIAIKNNTFLYAKYAVTIEPRHDWVLVSYGDKTVNVTDKYVIADRSVKEIKLRYGSTVFIVRLKWVSSFKEIPEVEEEVAFFMKLTFPDFVKYVIVGVVTTTTAIVFVYIALTRKRYAVIEGVG